jgi:hypothetical protein
LKLSKRRRGKMAVKPIKKATAKKAAVKKPAAKKAAPVRKASNSVKKGQAYECQVCGLAISIDEDCGCVDTCDIICCGKPMKAKAVKKKAR